MRPAQAPLSLLAKVWVGDTRSKTSELDLFAGSRAISSRASGGSGQVEPNGLEDREWRRGRRSTRRPSGVTRRDGGLPPSTASLACTRRGGRWSGCAKRVREALAAARPGAVLRDGRQTVEPRGFAAKGSRSRASAPTS